MTVDMTIWWKKNKTEKKNKQKGHNSLTDLQKFEMIKK